MTGLAKMTEPAGRPAGRPAPTGSPVAIPTRDPAHRRAERVMGTVVSLLAPDGGADSAAADACFAWLHEVDRRFSPFRPDSEVSQLMRGATPEFRGASARTWPRSWSCARSSRT